VQYLKTRYRSGGESIMRSRANIKTIQKTGMKICSMLVCTAILLSVVFFGNSNSFAATGIVDIDKSADYARASIEALAKSGIISGDEKGYFYPAKNVKRNEMVRIIISAIGADTTILPEKPTFRDVPKDNWAFKYVETAYRLGLVKGISKDVFGADKELSREEMAAMFVRAVGLDEETLKGNQADIYSRNLKDSNKISSWAREYVEFALASGIMQGTGNGNFSPSAPAQRQQVAVVTDRFISKSDEINRFAASFKGKIQHPELYYALARYGEAYKGGINMKMDLSMTDESGRNSFGLVMGAKGYMNSVNGSMDITYELSTDISGEPGVELNYRVVKVGGRYFVKYEDEKEWTEMDESEFGDPGLSGNEYPQIMLKFYRYADITKTGNVILDGRSVTRYTMNFRQEAINALISELINSQVYDDSGKPPVITGDNPYEISLFINSDGEIVKEDISFSGNMKSGESEENIYIEILLTVNYYNINEDIDIKIPVS